MADSPVSVVCYFLLAGDVEVNMATPHSHCLDVGGKGKPVSD